MDNYHDQARAIWNALDQMIQNDPEEYKKFVMEQLEEGRKMLKEQSLSKKDASGETSLEKSFETFSMGSGDHIRESDKKVEHKETVPKCQGGKRGEVYESAPALLDDEIGGKNSVLAQIIKKDFVNGAESDEEEVAINKLEIGETKAVASDGTKPLIEEL